MGHSWGDDFAAYLMQAQAIAEGSVDEYIARNTFTIENSTPGLGPVIYPWGYPLALSPFYALLGHNLTTYKLVNLVFLLGSLGMMYLLFRERLGEVLSLLISAFFAFHPAMRSSYNEIGSDLLFLFLVLLCIYLIDRWIVADMEIRSISRNIILGIVIFATVMTRTSGLVLLPTLFICQGVMTYRLVRQKKTAWGSLLLQLSLPYLVFLISWGVASIFLPAETETYLSQINILSIHKTIYQNIMIYTRDLLPEFWSAILGDTSIQGSLISTGRLFTWFLLGISLIGIFANLRRDIAFISFCGLSITLYLIWPYTQGLRFVYPLLPFWVYFSVQGIRWGIERIVKDRKWGIALPTILLVIAVGYCLMTTIQGTISRLGTDRMVNGPYHSNTLPLFNYIQDNTPPGSVVAFFKPRAMRLLTDRDSFTLTSCEQVHLADYFAAHKFNKMINSGQINPDRLGECEELEGESIKLIYDLPRYSLYQIRKKP